jgi:hypothetical protein
MKKPWVAFVLNFLLAGAGFVYLGNWVWALVDFFVTIFVGVAVYYLFPSSFSWISAAVPGINGVLAMNMARLWNSRGKRAG